MRADEFRWPATNGGRVGRRDAGPRADPAGRCEAMSIATLLAIGLVGLVLMLWGRHRARTESEDPDAATLDALARAGSHLEQPHEVEFYLYLPDQPAAAAVAEQLAPEGFQVAMRVAEEGSSDWLCLATRLMTPTLDELHRLRRHLAAVAESRGGAYDGWGAVVVESRGEA